MNEFFSFRYRINYEMMEEAKHCIIHYDSIQVKGSLRAVTEVSLKSLKENQEIRKNLGGDNYHYEQCLGVPDSLNSSYFLHPECFKKFTYAKTLAKRKGGEENPSANKFQKLTRSRQDVDVTPGERGIFPDICMICKKKKIKVNKKDCYTTQIVTREAENSLKNAAEMKNDTLMLLAINEVDLIAKEFKKHDKCYRDYTRIIYEHDDRKEDLVYDVGNYECVVKIVEEQVMSLFKCVSMDVLMEVYGIGDKHTQYRCKLKNRLLNTFGDKIIFLSPDYHSAQVIISSKCFKEQSYSSLSNDLKPEILLKNSANYLRELVKESIKSCGKLSWPPTVEELQDVKRNPPNDLLHFIKMLLLGDNHQHVVSGQKWNIIRSIADDLMYSISSRKYFTLKHCSLALGLHGMTGQKEPILLLSKLGHCITYDEVREIETAQSEIALDLQRNSSILPLQPRTNAVKVSNKFLINIFKLQQTNNNI